MNLRILLIFLLIVLLSGCSFFSLSSKDKNYYFNRSKELLEDNAASVQIGKLLWPVESHTLNSKYGPRNGSFHDGVDIKSPFVERVRAAHDGVVIRQDKKFRGYGKLLVLKGDSIVTFYGHLDDYVVLSGDTVKKGQVIGFVGNTGHATGPHLHFETRIYEPEKNWFAIDPMVFFNE
jgi:murein DD-endopeptidase MepM/ murein hydrolase activator NlpD